MKSIIVSVTNDLVTDQRVDRVCNTLVNMGFDVLLVGRRRRRSLPLETRRYRMKRMNLLFGRGPCFYAEYNIRLLLLLLFRKADIFLSNDLDTLPANYLASRLRKKEIVYDSHEYYTETPELVHRKFVQNIWERIEKRILPKLKYMYTVNDSIAGLYREKYRIDAGVVRNLPYRREYKRERSRKALGLPESGRLILLQGAGINIHRGTEEMVEAMQYIEGATFVIIGGGDVLSDLKDLVKSLDVEDKVCFIPKMPFGELYPYTTQADLAVTLDKDTNINYRFSLPNKLFDYIQARVPVLASDLVEIRKIVEDYGIGKILPSHEPEAIAETVQEMLSNTSQYEIWKENLSFAAEELCWENEEKKLIQIFSVLAG